jgi:thiamine biosynthesis lipoprotein
LGNTCILRVSAAVNHLGGLRRSAQNRGVKGIGELTMRRRAMACEFSVVFSAGVRRAVEAGYAALEEVDRLEDKLSIYREESDVSRLNRLFGCATVRTDAELYQLLRWAARLSEATGGAFDAASGALVKSWGFFRGPKRAPSEAQRTAALAASGWTHLIFDDSGQTVAADRADVELNLGGIGKGYAIDRGLHVIRTEYGIGSALMHGGQSSMKGIGAPHGEPRGWTVAIGDPLRPGRTVARVRLRDRALGTSGADHQFFVEGGRRYGHVLDPRTGWPARGLFSASAIAPTAMEADGLSTAFFVMGIEATRRFCETRPGVGAVLVAPGRVVVLGAADVEVTV